MNVFVIGPHRSGTSAVARLVNLCEFYVGEPEDLLPATLDNAMGYWEARWLVDFDDDLLFLFGADWRSAARLNVDSLPAPMLDELRQRAMAWCTSMDHHGHWVAKDPRLCLTAGFWLRLRPDALVVLCVRHPKEAVASMMHRTPCPFADINGALAAWRRHFLGAVVDTADTRRIVLDYGRLMAAPAGELARLVAFLQANIPDYAPPADVQQRMATELVPRLRHQTAEHLWAEYCEGYDVEAYAALLSGDQARLVRALTVFSDQPHTFDVNRLVVQRAEQEKLSAERLADKDRHIINLETQLAHLENQLVNLEMRLVENARQVAEQIAAKDHHISNLETHSRHFETQLHLAESEVKALKRSWSYRVGRVFVFPASAVKLGIQRLRGSKVPSSAPASPASVMYGLAPTQEALAKMQDAYQRLTARPLISILVPIYNTPPELLREALDSVLRQVYQEWELCLADDGSTRLETLAVLEEYCAKEPQRIKLVRLRGNSGIAVASNAAADLATGEFMALLDHDDLLTADALLEVALRLGKVPDADLIYSDEDKVTMDGRLEQPFHKPDFSPELLLSCNYICHFTTMRRTVFAQVGRFQEGFDGSQDYDLFLRVTEITRRAEHIPKILYHWRMVPGSAAVDVHAKGGPWRESSRKALRATIARRRWQAEVLDGMVPGMYRVKFAVDPTQRVTIIIPIKDKIELLQTCVESILKHTRHPSYEILVISNNSEEEKTYTYLEQARRDGLLRFLRYDVPFNYAAINNFAVRHCDSLYLLFLNNDTVVDSEGWLTSMLEFAQQEAIGAVGAKLLYPDNTIQHAGVILGIKGIAGHSHRGTPAEHHGYFGHANIIRNYSAVTAACLMTRRDVFEKVGGFNERLAVAFNDVDFCLEVRKAGYRIVYTPYARLYHHESASRGNDDSPDHATRFRTEIAYMIAKWGTALYNDPYYNPNLTLWNEDFSLKTALEEERQRLFALQFPPSAYKAVWNQLSHTETQARMHVIGSVHEEDFIATAHKTLEALEASVGIRGEDIILEIGCGVGRMGVVLAPRCQEWIGCDVSSNMLRYAAARLSRFHNVKFVETSGYDLRPVQDASVDLVYCTVVFMHLDEWDRYNYVLEAKRVLRPGGRLFMDNFNLCSDEGWSVFEQHRAIPPEKRPPHISRSSTPQELETYLKRAGFRSVTMQQSSEWVRGWGIK